MCSTTIIEFPSTFIAADIFKNYFFIVKSICVQPPLLARLATVSLCRAGGKPSTWFPPGGLVEPTPCINIQSIVLKDMLSKKIEFAKNEKS